MQNVELIKRQNFRVLNLPQVSVRFFDFLSVSFVKNDCSLTKKIGVYLFRSLFLSFLTTKMPSSQFQKRPCPFVWKEEGCTFFVRPKAMRHLMWIGRLSHPALIVGHLKRKTSV